MDESDLCVRDGGDLCEAEDNKLATARSHTSQLPPYFSKASHTTKTLFFIAVSRLKVKKSSVSPVSL